MNDQTTKIAYAKITGESVADGFLDARKSAETLLGLDEAVRHFVAVEDPHLGALDYDMPVGIRKSSVEIILPDNLVEIMKVAGGTAVATAYMIALANKTASDGLFEAGPVKDISKIFRGALKSIQWVIKICKHMKCRPGEKIGKITPDSGLAENMVLTNEEGAALEVPLREYEKFISCRKDIFAKLVNSVDEGRELTVGTVTRQSVEETTVKYSEKILFVPEKEEDDEFVLPELEHGMHVELEGAITRGNEKTNSIGFEYRGHVLTCYPANNDLVSFKDRMIAKSARHFFPPVRVVGVVDRKDKNGQIKEKKPHIIFTDVIPLEKRTKQPGLF